MAVTAAVVSRALAAAGFARSTSSTTKIRGFHERTAGYTVAGTYADGGIRVMYNHGSRFHGGDVERGQGTARMLREYRLALGTGRWAVAYDGDGVWARLVVREYSDTVTLSRPMAVLLSQAGILGLDTVYGPSGITSALVERGLVEAGETHPMTKAGRRLAKHLVSDTDTYDWVSSGTGRRTFPRLLR